LGRKKLIYLIPRMMRAEGKPINIIGLDYQEMGDKTNLKWPLKRQFS
jgi:hypothetical protein